MTENSKSIKQGDIVKFESLNHPEWPTRQGYFRVTSVRGTKCNLGSIFGKTIYHKGILVDEVVECHDEWYAKWSQSETYQCM